jgi:hypothetical protein
MFPADADRRDSSRVGITWRIASDISFSAMKEQHWIPRIADSSAKNA